MKTIIIIFTLLFLTSCSSHSVDDFREEGKGVVRSLIQDLKKIHTREELMAAVPQLKERFNHLADIMVEAEAWQKEHQAELPELSKESYLICDELRQQLNRVCQIEGGNDVISLCQIEALQRFQFHDKSVKMLSK